MRRGLWIGGAAAMLAALAAVSLAVRGLWLPAGAGRAPQLFQVREGDTLATVAQRLAEQGLLPRSAFFGPNVLVVYGRLAGLERGIKSGEYDVDPGETPVAILRKLVRGSVKTHAVTLPEGLRTDEVAHRLESAGIVEAQRFLELSRDPELTRSLGIEASSLEGYLYPETYRFRRNTPARDVLRQMVEEFRSRWTPADRAILARSGLSLHEAVTLASIVEKESAVDEERRLIAAVFRNRLARRMRLQSDPTVIYGLLLTRGTFDGNLRRRDLRTDTPYNTYTRSGLPPGPIANPTMESIRAVLEPEDVPYLYFVSRNDGTHEFSRTLREHNRAVERYQKRPRSEAPS
ncbi:MAG: endolytic transglycosylase MltG [Myxococcota bacterium]